MVNNSEVLTSLFNHFLPLMGEAWAASHFDANGFLVIRQASMIEVDGIGILFDFDRDITVSASDGDLASED